ncbi:hypothetical protein B0A49_06403 [Cryomyces minteri]|uniref:Lariat debranching enzyme C-terminal domain-containing protein n=1 Tax=Cryomyces minteri TaxID=331657 RepID=A0A4U0XA84_9PEZI|nr:hypothetical protein B0A49_06403 [Cryomyces minteri]
MPAKYREIGDFHAYYSGEREAPYLTIFVGGNHEASNYLYELYYGGWVAPNIYYLGAANIVRVGPLRIAGLSGIWKGYNYRKVHHERLPYNQSDVKSIYHVREIDKRKLVQVRSQIDIGISHDWPKGVEWMGDWKTLFRMKSHFEADARNGSLGSVAAKLVMDRLKPTYWFSAHLHCKFSAVVQHDKQVASQGPLILANSIPVSEQPGQSNSISNLPVIESEAGPSSAQPTKNADELELDLDDDEPDPPENEKGTTLAANADEIDLELDEGADDTGVAIVAAGQDLDSVKVPLNDDTHVDAPAVTPTEPASGVSNALRALLPESFVRPAARAEAPKLDPPPDITNRVTKFLALDKCLPNRHFLQILDVDPISEAPSEPGPICLEHDKEWLAITRCFGHLDDANCIVGKDEGEAFYRRLIHRDELWVEEHLVKTGKMVVPENFEITAPVYDATLGIQNIQGQPREYSNNQTRAFCKLLHMPNCFHAEEEDILARTLAAEEEEATLVVDLDVGEVGEEEEGEEEIGVTDEAVDADVDAHGFEVV